MGASDWSGKRFLDDHIDEGLKVDMEWTPEDEVVTQIERLSSLRVVLGVAKDMPRRLGQDATDAELRADKRCARQVYQRVTNSLAQWSSARTATYEQHRTPTEEERQQGAQIEWKAWWMEHKRYLEQRVRFVATHASKLGHRNEANRMVNRLLNEARTLDEVLG